MCSVTEHQYVQYFKNVIIILITGLQVSPTYKSQCHRFSLMNRYVPCNMILMNSNFFFFAILKNAEAWPMWKIHSVPCNSNSNKFYCISIGSILCNNTAIQFFLPVVHLLQEKKIPNEVNATNLQHFTIPASLFTEYG
jgi:hypothetical protein